MAEAFLRSFDCNLKVYSAGTVPSSEVHPKAVKVMQEVGIDLSMNYPKSVDNFLNENFDYVITVCGGAKESCPAFSGNVGHRLHMGFEDPAEAKGTEIEILKAFREIRDMIKRSFSEFYQNYLKAENQN